MAQAAVPVRTSTRDLVYTELVSLVQLGHGLKIADGAHDFASEPAFQVLVANTRSKSRVLSKGTVIAYDKRYPLALLTSDDEIEQGVGVSLRIPEHTLFERRMWSLKKAIWFYSGTQRRMKCVNRHGTKDQLQLPTRVVRSICHRSIVLSCIRAFSTSLRRMRVCGTDVLKRDVSRSTVSILRREPSPYAP